MKLLVACGSGIGTSVIIQKKIVNILTNNNVDATVDHTTIDKAKDVLKEYDAVFCPELLKKQFVLENGPKVIGIKNLLSDAEIEEKIKEHGII
ncbi:PTS sugar transporter subunit IIB [Bacillus sp. N9]